MNLPTSKQYSPTRPWFLLGAGAIGSLAAKALNHAGIAQKIIPGNTLAQSEKSSLTISIIRNTDASNFQVGLSGPEDTSAIDKLLVCTKAHQVEPALKAIAPRISDNCRIVLLTNGLGYQQNIGKSFPSADLYLASTTEGAFRADDNTIVHAGLGETLIGQSGLSQAPQWLEDCNTIPRCRWEANIDLVLQKKLAVNCTINALTAVNRCTNSELLSNRDLHGSMRELVKEIQAVYQAAGFTKAAEKLLDTVEQVAQITGNNRSSMLQDVLAGRKTEIDFINGYLLKLAKQYHVHTPLNQQLVDKILHAQHSS